jgi:hypothetical protein
LAQVDSHPEGDQENAEAEAAEWRGDDLDLAAIRDALSKVSA